MTWCITCKRRPVLQKGFRTCSTLRFDVCLMQEDVVNDHIQIIKRGAKIDVLHDGKQKYQVQIEDWDGEPVIWVTNMRGDRLSILPQTSNVVVVR